ncbi:MAG: hypothetical protein FJ147_24340 [Deltaproteobacteria bacterium]|nr:hypothetical protein [Deltaproteobacteria bacterium]
MSTTIQSPPSTDPRTAAEWIEFYYAQGWSDGLPLVPPTEESVAAMLAAGGLTAKEILGTIDERNAILPAEKVAINAVMAGCLPTYFPVVVAAVRALCHPDFHYHNPATSTGGSGLALIVNGPIGPRLGINATNNVFGPGVRANATIGRALRLVMMNVLNTRPGYLDKGHLARRRSTLSVLQRMKKTIPGRRSMCHVAFVQKTARLRSTLQTHLWVCITN